MNRETVTVITQILHPQTNIDKSERNYAEKGK